MVLAKVKSQSVMFLGSAARRVAAGAVLLGVGSVAGRLASGVVVDRCAGAPATVVLCMTASGVISALVPAKRQ